MNYNLKQARDGQKWLVNADPQTISIIIPDSSDDPWSPDTTTTFTGRISYKAEGLDEAEEGTSGVRYPLKQFLSVQYDVDYLFLDAIITDEADRDWRVGKPYELRRFGGVYGYQADLEAIEYEST